MGQHPFEEDKSMASTKLVAHQYVCIRALEAILAQINEEFGTSVTYRIESVNLPETADDTRLHVIKGKLLSFQTEEAQGRKYGKFKITFSCWIRLYKLLTVWQPSDFEFSINEDRFVGYIGASSTYEIKPGTIRRLIRPS